MLYLDYCLVFNHLDGEERQRERDDCFTLGIFPTLVIVSFLWLFLAIHWAGLQCVILVCSGYTHLLNLFECVA